MDEIFDEIADYIAEEITSVTVAEELTRLVEDDLKLDEEKLLRTLIPLIDVFLDQYKAYGYLLRQKETNIDQRVRNLEICKEVLYNNFFEIQNILNAYVGQRIVLTYVHIDQNGQRSIRISDNNTKHLQSMVKHNPYGNYDYARLEYIMDKHYRELKNSLSETQDGNKGLQDTAKEVERRYRTYKKRVLWFYPNEWKGYRIPTMGPINEAFTNFYVHNIQLKNSMEGNIDEFMTGPYGAIKADNANGFMIGDVSIGGLQFAVKGIGGGPQGMAEVYKALRSIRDKKAITSWEDLRPVIERFVTEEPLKRNTPQITKLSKNTVNGVRGSFKFKEDPIFSNIVMS